MSQSCQRVTGEMPLVSIITTTLNSEQYVEETIVSVAEQTYGRIEHIVVDGCSTDRTLEIIQRHSDSIACWLSEPDANHFEAINKGIGLSKGDIIAIMNSDDKYYSPETIQFVVDAFRQYPEVDGIYGDLVRLYPDHTQYKRVFQVNYREYLFSRKGTFVPHMAMFVKRSLVQRIGLYDEKYAYASDYDYILRCLSHGTLKYINVPLAYFRVHGESITASGRIKPEKLLILEDHHLSSYGRAEVFLRSAYLWSKYTLLNLLNASGRIGTLQET